MNGWGLGLLAEAEEGWGVCRGIVGGADQEEQIAVDRCVATGAPDGVGEIGGPLKAVDARPRKESKLARALDGEMGFEEWPGADDDHLAVGGYHGWGCDIVS